MSTSRRAHFDEVWRAKIAAGEGAADLRGNLRANRTLALLAPGRRLLDLGCGSGVFAQAARARFTDVHGVDISAGAVDLARRHGVDAQLLDVSADALPYADGTFDAITALSMLQYVFDLDHVLRECRRVLRPGGQLIACVPNMRAAWRLWSLAIAGRFPRTSLDAVGVDGGTIHYFTSRTAADAIARSGFEIVHAYGMYCLPRWLEPRAERGPFAGVKREFFSAEVLFDARAKE